MNHNKLITIGLILTLGLVITTGCLEKGEVKLRIDEKESSTGITIKNNLSKEIYLPSTPYIQETKTIKKLENGEWKQVKHDAWCKCENKDPCTRCPALDAPIPQVKKVTPNEKVNYNWNEKEYVKPEEKCNGQEPTCYTGKKAEKGTYKVEICYSTDYKPSNSDRETKLIENNLIIYADLKESQKKCIEKEFKLS